MEGTRILAVRADPAEAAPGERVELRALVARPGNDLAGVRLDWALCLAPRSQGQTGPVPDACSAPVPDPAMLAQPQRGLLPGDAYRLEVPVLDDLDPTVLSLPDSTGGVYLAVRLVARHGDEVLPAVYRLRLHTGDAPKNAHPELEPPGIALLGGAPLTLDGPAVPVEPGGMVRLQARFVEGADERFLAPTSLDPGAPVEPQKEVLRFSWFVDRGTIDPPYTGGAGMFETRWTLPADGPGSGGEQAFVWVVLRDSRGGASWHVGRVRLR